MFRKLSHTILFFLSALSSAFAQAPTLSPAAFPIFGIPDMQHFSREDFKADPQFWSVCEDKAGILYFGNNDGALAFDGERWHKIYLPNNSAVRSLTTDHKGQVWAGGYNQIGQIRKDRTGRFYYASLLDSLQLQDNSLENLWQVHALENTVVFRSFNKLIAISNNKVTELPTSSTFNRSYLVGNELYISDRSEGLLRLDVHHLQFSTVIPAAELMGEYIVSLLPASDPQKLLAIAQSGSVFTVDPKQQRIAHWKTLFEEGSSEQLINAIKADDGLYYLGTLGSRIIVMDDSGRIIPHKHALDRLQDKTVLNLYQTRNGNLWALLNNGLVSIDFNAVVSTLFENASIYDVLIHNNAVYLATNQGMFFAPLPQDTRHAPPLNFQKIKGLEGQAWSLQLVAGDVLGGHDRGLFVLNGTAGNETADLDGIWKVIPAAGNPGKYLASSYSGLYLLEKNEQGEWQSLHKISGFNESTRDIMPADSPGAYWVCHGYKGVYLIKIDEGMNRVTAVEHFTDQHGLPSPFNVNVVRWQGQTVFTTNQGIYRFDANQNKFVPFPALNRILDPALNTRKLLQHGDKTWFVQDDEAGFFRTNAPNPVLQKELFLQFKGAFNRGMECIVPLDSQRVLFGTNVGLYLFDFSTRTTTAAVPTEITSVRYTIDQEEKELPLALHATGVNLLPNNTSTLRFEFAAPGMPNNTAVQYSYRLDEVDKSWSPWKQEAFKEYSHLRPGRYTFKVRSRSLLGASGQESTYQFEVQSLWYNTPWAWALYAVLAVLFMMALLYLISRRISRENNKARLEEQKARKLLELELQQMKLKSEKERISQEKELLEEDVLYKSKELANYTMLLVKKREIFTELIQDLKSLRELAKNENSRTKVRELIRKITHHLSDEEYLQVFDTNFEKIHHEFLSVLKEMYPDLSQRDLRLCAFVKMNLTNKEISPLLNISVRGVETARYRIRKKLNLEHEHNLVEFLEKMSPATQESLLLEDELEPRE